MDKTGFLKELKQHLAVLNEGEQKDILDEYAQHIDMKMERGMSEAEAIRDFGEIGELASEILEAYHVNPQYGAKKRAKFVQKEEIPVAEIAETGRRFWSKGMELLKKLSDGIAAAMSGAWRLVKKPFACIKKAWDNRKHTGGFWDGQKEMRAEAQAAGEYEMVRRKRMFGEIPGMAVRGIQRLFMALLCLAAWCIRWIWNIFMLFIALLTVMLMLGSLFGLGMLAVLLIQGYPLAGVTLICLGVVLSTGAVTVVALCLLKRRHKETQIPAYEEHADEAAVVQEVEKHA